MSTVEALEWLYEKGIEEFEQGHLEAARERFQAILQRTRDADWTEKANAKLAQVYLKEDNLFWAMDHVHRALKRNRREPEYHYIKGTIHFDRDEWHEAANEAVKAVEHGLDEPRYYRLLGKAVYEYEGYTSAREFLEWALECDPSDNDVRLDFARIEIREGNFQKALHLLKEAVGNGHEDERILESIRAIQENWEINGG
ncbi:MAG: tetratricopeptide repeat protein [bacterium]